MKNLRLLSRLTLFFSFLAFLEPFPAVAFHSGGVGYCDGCHTIHNSSEGGRMSFNPVPAGQGNPYLLQGSDPSSTCLICHERPDVTGQTGQLISTPKDKMPAGIPPANLTPGGDFGWLRKDFTWISESGQQETSPGYEHGHNIVALDFDYSQDAVRSTAPGGTYPAETLYCTSCHDPHGRCRVRPDGSEVSYTSEQIYGSGSYGDSPPEGKTVGTYRLLGGVGYDCRSNPGHSFQYPAPAATAPLKYNRAESDTMTRVAYGRGMSEWCGNCHVGMLSQGYTSGEAGHAHPAGRSVTMGPTVANNYNSYVRTGDISGTQATSYLSLVPYEDGNGNDEAGRTAMRDLARIDNSKLGGPNSGANVMCITCHRAHASAWDGMLRWNGRSEFIAYKGAYPGTDNGAPPWMAQGRTSAESSRGYYGFPAINFDYVQRSLCNKCHMKD